MPGDKSEDMYSEVEKLVNNVLQQGTIVLLHTCMHAHTHAPARTHTHMHTYTHTYTHR